MPPSPVETIAQIAAMAGVGYVTFAFVSFNEMKNKSNERLAAGDFDKPPPQKVQLKSDTSSKAARATRLAKRNAKQK